MSPGFCSVFVITVLIIQPVTLFHAHNVLFTAKGRYQVNFRIDTKVLLQTFSNCNLFHPDHPQLKTLTDSLDTLI